MSDRRENDTDGKSYYRSDRLFQEGGRWFFATREGSIEGPFVDRYAAVTRLEAYIKVMRSGLMASEDLDNLRIMPNF
ncbi:MAG: DUF6316 family protein [Halioglobus sp.]|nr:DUF6316 family protein [Halioglobus sp.]